MKTVAILGASSNPEKYGNRAVHAFRDRGYQVYPVNPKADEIEGLTAFANIESIPEKPNVVSAYLPPAILLKVLPQIADRGCDELWLNPGTDEPGIVSAANELGLNTVIGCSLVGLISGKL
ncbi:MAG: CoA-binding protein [Verrucomicrobiales bacterium]|nr:CoA-binding protein [Verrucomicrobiales bacterium]|tara:strand:+ start:553 stop:915 length:363 start_codon:yes stop_codon:yes gene_type:complete